MLSVYLYKAVRLALISSSTWFDHVVAVAVFFAGYGSANVWTIYRLGKKGIYRTLEVLLPRFNQICPDLKIWQTRKFSFYYYMNC